nr:reverse transcriptase domain-containing protein [Tanacetum cinerariifolium]
MGQMSLPVKIGDAEHSTSTWMNFVVVRSPSPYNGIKGRPKVKKIQAVPSTVHGMLKFPVPGGILTLRSSKIIPLECTMLLGPKAQPSAITRVAKERIKVAIHLEYLEQTIAIGSTLTEEGQNDLCDLFRRCPPVRQKKRSQAPKRNKAIQEEVDKLVDVGIIKEVYYHSWLSNPIMVKKHDNNWRMCVDFKDLRYHQIKMAKEDEEKTTFITSQRIFCYLKITFGLKNDSATYQCLVDKVFQKQISRNLEVYVEDLVIKNRIKQEIIRDIEETLNTLREINMKLNPKKCTFGMEEGMFLGYKEMAKEVLPSISNHCHHGPANQVDFIVKWSEDDSTAAPMEVKEELPEAWKLFTNRSSCIDGSRARLILTDLKGIEFTYVMRFRFDATNNKAEYEALIASLRIIEKMGVKNLQTYVDSRLVANQINGSYTANEPGMMQYLKKVKMLASNFKKFLIKQVPRSENKKAGALSKNASTSFAHLTKQVLVEELKEKLINEAEVLAFTEEE